MQVCNEIKMQDLLPSLKILQCLTQQLRRKNTEPQKRKKSSMPSVILYI